MLSLFASIRSGRNGIIKIMVDSRIDIAAFGRSTEKSNNYQQNFDAS